MLRRSCRIDRYKTKITRKDKHMKSLFLAAMLFGGTLCAMEYSTPRKYRYSLLHTVATGTLKEVKALIDNGIDPHTENGDWVMGLHVAAERGSVEMAKFFLEQRIGIDIPTKYKRTPLLIAVSNNQKDVVEFLLERGASLSSTDRQGTSIMALAESLGFEEVLELLKAYATNASESAGDSANVEG